MRARSKPAASNRRSPLRGVVVAGAVLGVLAALPACRRAEDEAAVQLRVRTELLDLARTHRDARAFQPFGPVRTQADAQRFASALAAMEDTDRRNVERLKRILDAHGWPGRKLAGADGAEAAWLIAQHATHDLPFMERAAELMGDAVRREDAEARRWAMLVDRLRQRQGRPQVYGTQFVLDENGGAKLHPVENPAGLEQRRRDVGLPPMDSFEKAVRDNFENPNP